MVPSVTGHQEGSHLSLTWVVVPILFSLGDVSTDVANPFRAGDGDRTRDKSLEGSHVTATPHPQGDPGRTRTYDRLLRRQLLYSTELLDHA